MPGFLGYTSADELLNFVYRGIAITIGSDLYMRLLVQTSNRGGGGTETNYGNYARLLVPRDTSMFAASASGELINIAVVEYATPSSVGNGDLIAFDFVDTPSGAFTKLYHGGPLVPADPVVIGKPPKYPAGKLKLGL